ncbi:hypothetical protein GE061_014312 [Apolygus lucorum]|uniref:Endonuclease/exonuclease/phosphatase domain-containing protein n=1 Tax=Apolygus lucorum TaxID=248454 RepID=A0A6A4KB86_APOLU|nr:hypothetical protein GE061_014312 [Apolygus lucorum]
MGRACGGILSAHKMVGNERIDFKFEEHFGMWILKITWKGDSENELICVPSYLRQEVWDDELQRVRRVLEEVGDKPLLWIGDMNARTGSLQVVSDELLSQGSVLTEERKSKDEIVNSRGMHLVEMCDELSLVILNGRSPSDELGGLTFISHLGVSVNDYACISTAFVDNVVIMRVDAQFFSDHMPLVVELAMIRDAESGVGVRNRLRWTTQDSLCFINRDWNWL